MFLRVSSAVLLLALTSLAVPGAAAVKVEYGDPYMVEFRGTRSFCGGLASSLTCPGEIAWDFPSRPYHVLTHIAFVFDAGALATGEGFYYAWGDENASAMTPCGNPCHVSRDVPPELSLVDPGLTLQVQYGSGEELVRLAYQAEVCFGLFYNQHEVPEEYVPCVGR